MRVKRMKNQAEKNRTGTQKKWRIIYAKIKTVNLNQIFSVWTMPLGKTSFLLNAFVVCLTIRPSRDGNA